MINLIEKNKVVINEAGSIFETVKHLDREGA